MNVIWPRAGAIGAVEELRSRASVVVIYVHVHSTYYIGIIPLCQTTPVLSHRPDFCNSTVLSHRPDFWPAAHVLGRKNIYLSILFNMLKLF